MKTLDIQYRQAQSVNIDLGMLDIANFIDSITALDDYNVSVTSGQK